MDWKKVDIKVSPEAVEAVGNIMNEIGADGIEINEGEGWSIITSYYPDDNCFPDVLNDLRQRINNLNKYGIKTGDIEINITLTNNEDWSTSWHEYFKPVKAGRFFLICPTWDECNSSDRIVIKIDPGMAFGIGSHETTRMSIEFLEKYIKPDLDNMTMIDIGTGTGILAIAAVYLGADKVTAIDNSKAALKAARDNVIQNRVSDQVDIILGDLTQDINKTFHMITANLLPDLILRLLPSIPSLMNEETIVILSGIIIEKKEQIIDQLKKYDLKVIDEKQMDEWISLVVIKR